MLLGICLAGGQGTEAQKPFKKKNCLSIEKWSIGTNLQ